MLALYIIGGIFAYAMFAGLFGGMHHKKQKALCRHGSCWTNYWCSHAYASVYIFGLLWLPALPVLAGILASGVAGVPGTRVERRRKREIEEAKHQAELSEIKAREHAALDRELAIIAGK